MKILIDSREQTPLTFKHPYITDIITTKLDVGDYGCQFESGHVVPHFFERKSLPDLYGSLTRSYRRFKREIQRAHNNQHHIHLIIEGSLTKTLKGTKHSTVPGPQIVQQIFTLWMRHGINPVFTTSRPEMAQFILRFYYACGLEYLKQNNGA